MDEEALLKQFAAQFAHGPDDADDTDAAAAAQGADSTANQVADDADQSPATFDTQQFLNGLDAIFDRHTAATEAGPYLEQAMVDAENAGDEAGLLTVLNETMGFYRSQGRHKENQWIVQRALELAARMGLTTGTSEAWATTLINCATSMRAAKQYDQAEDLYHQAQSVCRHSLAPTDRRLAALHNNLSMLYSETNRPDKAELELREALRIIEASSVNPDADIDAHESGVDPADRTQVGGRALACSQGAGNLSHRPSGTFRALCLRTGGLRAGVLCRETVCGCGYWIPACAGRDRGMLRQGHRLLAYHRRQSAAGRGSGGAGRGDG